MTTAVRQRPKHLNLFKIRQPIPAIVSILHRISGAVLFLFFIPFGLSALQGSLHSAESFAQWYAAFANHCSLFPTAAVIEQFKEELKDFSTSKGTIHFPLNKPMPIDLIKTMVRERLGRTG